MATRKCVTPKRECREPLSPITSSLVSSRVVRTRCKTPKTPASGKKQINPGRDENCAYDRFIPNRTQMDTKVCHYLLYNEDNAASNSNNDNESNNDINQLNSRILQIKIKAAPSKEGDFGSKLLYSSTKQTPLKSKSSRHIPSTADKILDAPEICNDYYLNLLDWGTNGLVAISLHQSVYVWNNQTGVVHDLLANYPIVDDNLTITGVKWMTDGDHLALGLSNGYVQIWDAAGGKRVRSMTGHAYRVGCLDWNEHILTSGCKSGAIHNHDVRIAEHHVSSFKGHTQEVCGMQWHKDGKHFASGGNDNALNIWDLRKVNDVASAENPAVIDTPLMSLTDHTAAVKAVAWCPWQRHVIASGGGLADRHVRFWNTERGSGVCLRSVDTMSQVSNILWSGTYHEVIASHGNHMSIWKYPTLQRETLLTGHSDRILCMAMSPDGADVASVGADETLRVWKCFVPPPKKTVQPKGNGERLLCKTIR